MYRESKNKLTAEITAQDENW